MKPLLIMVTYNRRSDTRQTLKSLFQTGTFEQAEVCVFDNGSVDGTSEMLSEMMSDQLDRLILHSKNIGCPRALNYVMQERRKAGQPVIKVDNDVEMLTGGWVGALNEFAAVYPEVALLSPWYDGVVTGRHQVDRGTWIETFPIVGHCCYHAGWFLDEVGFFDVLSDDHLYGFEDLLMSHRAGARGYKCGVVKAVEMQNIQRHNSLDVGQGLGTNEENRQAHVARLRPLYDARKTLAHYLKKQYYVNALGQIQPVDLE